jgi:DNA processing protein
MADDERLVRLALSRAKDVGDAALLAAVHEHGPWAARERLLAGRDRDDAARVAAELCTRADPVGDLEVGRRLGARFVIPGDDEWPDTLDDLEGVTHVPGRGGVPIGLWVRGPLRLDELVGSVAVVGTRDATAYGALMAEEIAAACADAGRAVVSGGAIGIDYSAHRGAVLAGGRTAAVLACGVDRLYPLQNAPMLSHFVEHSALVSEAPLGHAPRKLRFLVRNRLIAALAAGTVVVEAALRSGALNTAGWANALSRPVMGIPGPVGSGLSAGVNAGIRKGELALVTSGEEVLELVAPMGEALVTERRGPVRVYDDLSPDQMAVLEALPAAQGAPVDRIATNAGHAVATTEAALEELALRGLAVEDLCGWRVG